MLEIPENAEGYRGNSTAQPGYKYTNPMESLKRLQSGIRSKIEVSSNYGTIKDQQRVLRQLFAKYDADLSGNVNKAEFFTIMQAFALFGSDTDKLFEQFDKDGNGTVSIDEFIDVIYDDGSRSNVNSKSAIYNNVGDEDDNTESYKRGGRTR